VNRKALLLVLASVLAASAGSAIACEYKAGETIFLEYANCRYGEESIVAVDLPEDSNWETCIYLMEAFRPDKLLAVTKQKDGKEIHSINARGNIGNPCYLTKQSCDAAMKAHKATQQ
jgi:hypothetical protein